MPEHRLEKWLKALVRGLRPNLTRICPYCGLSCALPPDVDMHGECGCCCQWLDNSRDGQDRHPRRDG
jgi:hypothetical protein